jgi:hypothetical protein
MKIIRAISLAAAILLPAIAIAGPKSAPMWCCDHCPPGCPFCPSGLGK